MGEGEPFDILVVGAGLSGIAASRFYLDVHSESRILILEQDTSPGGPWGHSRMYPGFWSQSGIRMSGFSDVPLTVPKEAEVFNDIFEAKYVSDYLENYVDNHVYNGETLRQRMKFGFTVIRIMKDDGIWIVQGTEQSEAGMKTFRTKKLIVATGTTSDPKMPSFPGSEDFKGQILHQTNYGKFRTEQSQEHRKVTVLGGGKSAADIVYTSVKAGNDVSWVIRESGEGPGAFTNPADNATGKAFLNDPELAATRLFGTISPSLYGEPSWWTWMLHNTGLGRRIVDGFWGKADQKCKDIGDFRGRPGALKGFEQLESDVKIFWTTGPIGMIQRKDFWDTIARNVHVYRRDIDCLEATSIRLKDGPSVPADVIICATGFSNKYSFFDHNLHIDLGLPHPIQQDDEEKSWTILESAADKTIIQAYPKLANPPAIAKTARAPPDKTPNRLYNCMAPLHDASIVFVGNIYVPNGFRCAEVQAIWATAYLDGAIQLPSEEAMRTEIARVNAFERRRYPTHGRLGNYFHFDMMGYIDRLLAEVGLSSHRKGWWADWMQPLVTKDLGGLRDEYLGMYRMEEKGGKVD